MTNLKRRSVLVAGVGGMSALGALAPRAALAQATGQGRIIVGNAPGGGTDHVARLIAPFFNDAQGRTFVVENRPGASGNIAAAMVAGSPPDGSTMLLIFNAHATTALLNPRLAFDPIKDFSSVGEISESPYLVVARPGIGVNDLRALIERSVRTKQPITAGTPGQGTPLHIMFEALKSQHNVDMVISHYKGSAPAMTDVMGGHIDMTLATPALAGQQVQAGKLSVIGVTSRARLPEYPNVPTMGELGISQWAGAGAWFSVVVPARTPRSVVAAANGILNEALKNPQVLDRLKTLGMTARGGSAESMDAKLRAEADLWAPVIRSAKITAE